MRCKFCHKKFKAKRFDAVTCGKPKCIHAYALDYKKRYDKL